MLVGTLDEHHQWLAGLLDVPTASSEGKQHQMVPWKELARTFYECRGASTAFHPYPAKTGRVLQLNLKAGAEVVP